MTITTVTTITEFNNAVSSAIAGDEIQIAAGVNLGTRSITGKSLAAPGLKITSASLTNHGVFYRFTLTNCTEIHVENVTIHADALANDYDVGLAMKGCTNCSAYLCNIIGTQHVWNQPSADPVAQRTVGWGHGYTYENCAGCSVKNSYFRHWKRAIKPVARVGQIQTALTYSMNMMENVDGDRFVVEAVDGITIEDNYMINARSNQTLLNPDHVDGIQGQVTGNPAVAQIKNLTYRRNIVDIGNGHNSQIFFIAHEAFRNGVTTNPADAHQDFIVEDNLGISRTTHGISMSSVNNGTLQRNAVFRAPAINPDTFIGNDLTNNGVTVPDLRMTAEGGFGCTGAWTVKDNFAGAQAGSPAGATILNNLYQDPSITPFDTLYASLVTGFSSVYDASGAPYDQNHLNMIWPKAGGALATGLIGPTWWHNGSFAGWGPYNTGVQPAKPGDTSLWGLVALMGGSTAPPTWTPSTATINVQVN